MCYIATKEKSFVEIYRVENQLNIYIIGKQIKIFAANSVLKNGPKMQAIIEYCSYGSVTLI